jgi:hypothetical protein
MPERENQFSLTRIASSSSGRANNHILKLLLLLAIGTASAATQAVEQEAPWVVGVDQIRRLDLLPAIKRTIEIGAVTSYDRTGGNDDGFSGKYSFIRKEGDGLVIADLKGPGCITRIHTPTPTDDPLEFYFDGESTPRLRLPFRQLFTGQTAPFLRPLVDNAAGGYYCYVPILYQKSCKVVLRAPKLQFYDLNFVVYPDAAPVKTYDPEVSAADLRAIETAGDVLKGGRSSDLTGYNVPPGTSMKTHRFDGVLEPGKSVTLFETRRGGRFASLRISPADAFVSKDRDIYLRITWDKDKQPSILCPAGDFFGYAWGKPSMGSCLLGTYETTNYCNFPMPFGKAAKVELVSLRKSGSAVSVRSEIIVGDTPKRPYEGRFYAVWNRENPTTEGKPFTYLETTGNGHVVGLALQAQGKESGSTEFFEGDDMTTIDGELAIHGTGSEDSFNGGWYDVPGRWDGPVALPLSGCMLYQKHLGRTGGYRFMIGDAYSYHKSILQTIEHAPEKNIGIADYCAVTYFYSLDRPNLELAIPSLKARQVVDPRKMTFSPHWNLPISSFCLADATLGRKSVQIGDKPVRCLSLRPKGNDFFGPPFITFVCDVPAGGRYRVLIDSIKGPDCGQVRLLQDASGQDHTGDLYAESLSRADGMPMGEVEAQEGNNNLMFSIVGKNSASSALGFDLISIILEKVPASKDTHRP